MIYFKPIKDWRKVWELCCSTGDVERLFDDKTPYTRQAMKKRIHAIVEDVNNRVYEILDGNTQAGCFIMYDLKDGVFEIHILLKKGFRGRDGIYIGKCGTEFSLSLPGVKQLVSFCPDSLRESFVYALLVGWRSLGYLPMLWKKGGIDYKVRGVCAI